MIRFTVVVLLILLGACHCGLAAETIMPSPGVRLFSSANGRWGFKVTVAQKNWQQSPATGTLLTWNPDGTEKVIWRHQLVNIPWRAIVYDGAPVVGLSKDDSLIPTVVTTDTWSRTDEKHSLVIYDSQGMVRKHSLKDLLTKEEFDSIPAYLRSFWLSRQSLSFKVPMVPDQPVATHVVPRYGRPQLEIRLETGRSIILELIRQWGKPEPVPATEND